MSEHIAEVVELTFQKLENSDNLGLAKVYDFPYVGRMSDWGNFGEPIKACFFYPDTLVDTSRPEFLWMAEKGKYTQTSELGGPYARVRTIKLRGCQSYGIAVKAPEFANVGDNLWEYFGCGHYDPDSTGGMTNRQKLGLGSGEIAKAPSLEVSHYDIENARKFANKIFTPGELVNVSEKIHGQYAAFVYCDGEFHVKSKNVWKREYAQAPQVTLEQLIERMDGNVERATAIYEKNVVNFKTRQSSWWWILRETPNLMDWLKANEGCVVHGEVYGPTVQAKFPYDAEKFPKLRLFDISDNGLFLDSQYAREISSGLPWVPEIFPETPYDFEMLTQRATGYSTLNEKVILEGLVIKSVKERYDFKYGRAIVKLISPLYSEKS